ncbi:hypothetical protein SAMN05421693_10918 [Ectothiorhodospira magna]|uniref:Tetratricopeptide repeat-containing protein n=1 Tax=Ectothiorhodospira magna TaxID=867345 RepID=A0A1H9BGY5_9GAMM|nr:hypothetical protein [Ectothiorhodospira magna]SEP88252.1 hypothetical protein SAMN05421693_10918 [Ectothiorhodospira magna]
MRRPGLILLLILGLSACSTVKIYHHDPEHQLQSALQQGDIARVRDILETLPVTDEMPQEQVALRAWLKAVQPHLEQAMLMQAAEHLRREQWEQAWQSYARGLAMLPESTVLRHARDQAVAERQTHLRRLHTRRLLAQGQSLLVLPPIQAQILRLDPTDEAARQALYQAGEDAPQVAAALARMGQEALAAGEHHLAVEALDLSQTLSPSATTATALYQAQAAQAQYLAAQRQARQARRQAQWAQRTQTLFNQVQEAMTAGDLATAHHHLAALKQARPEDESVRALGYELARNIDKTVAQGLEHGRQLYLEGRIPEALDTWRNLQSLQPEHPELQSHVQRAERALESLRRLETASDDPP